jgi:hypothetical protein
MARKRDAAPPNGGRNTTSCKPKCKYSYNIRNESDVSNERVEEECWSDFFMAKNRGVGGTYISRHKSPRKGHE